MCFTLAALRGAYSFALSPSLSLDGIDLWEQAARLSEREARQWHTASDTHGRSRWLSWAVLSSVQHTRTTHPISIQIGSRSSTIRSDLFAATVPMLIISALMSGHGSRATTVS